MKRELMDQIDGLFSTWDRPDSPGCALGVYQEGELAYESGYGSACLEHGVPITPSTVFHVASISKQFTAVAVGLLARSGCISLEDDIRSYVPEVPAGPPITFRHLIHHTSGLRDQWDLLNLAGWRQADLRTTGDILRLVARQRALNFSPGTRFQYINTSYTLMAVAIERVTGLSLQRYAKENIFEPLGMRHTRFHDDHRLVIKDRALAYSVGAEGQPLLNLPAYETVGPTGLLSTVGDFALWERNFLMPTVGDEEFLRQVLAPGVLSDGRALQYGFGLILGEYRGLSIVEHAGGDAGYRAHYLRFPGERLAVAVFSNAAGVKAGLLARQVADLLLAGRLQGEGDPQGHLSTWAGRAAGVLTPSVHELEAKVGLYKDVWGGAAGSLRLKLRGGRLFLMPSTGGEYELEPVGEERYRFLGMDAECCFTPAQGGKPMQMTVRYAGQLTAICERMEGESRRPGLPGLEYAGSYQSDELGVCYTLAASGGGLVLRREGFADARLQLHSEDEGVAGEAGMHIRFVRDGQGRISGLSLSTERVWNVHFVRTG